MRSRIAFIAGVLLVAGLVRIAPLPAQQTVDFAKDVQPILNANCVGCHRGDSAPSGLRLDSPAGILAGGESGKAIVAGNTKDSMLIQRVATKSMPPTGGLKDADIATLTKWVEQGASMGNAAVSNTSAPVKPLAANYTSTPLGAFFNQYCIGCHNQTLKTGGLMLDTLDPAHVEKDADKWEHVVHKLRSGMMPPSGKPRPDAKTMEAMIQRLEGELDKHAVSMIPPPGLHRLNRTEYHNVVRDLLGVEIDPAKFLPSDDSTRGFDNVAAALTVSPALIEGYASAAGKIARIAVGTTKQAVEVPYRVPEDTSQDYHIEGLPFGTRGGILIEHEFPADGEYSIKIMPISKGNMGNNTPFGEIRGEKLEVLLDGERKQIFDWDRAAGGRNGGGMEAKFVVKGGVHNVGVTFLATNYAPGNDLDEHFLRSTIETGGLPGFTFFPHVGKVSIKGPFNPAGAPDSESRKKIFSCYPANAAQETTCARQIVNNLGRRAFRRPMTANDSETLLGFYQQGRNEGTFDDGIEMAVRRVLADPEFVFRREKESANAKPGVKTRITDVELASRLSFFLWSSIPDDELLKLAEQNRLHEPAVLDAQVKRMLADPKSDELVVNFAGQWLNLRGLAAQAPTTSIFPDFDDNLRQAMRRETELFVDNVVHEDRPVLELLDAKYTFLNERLARHYGIPNVYGSQFRRVELTPEFDMRRGLLGKGSLLTMSSLVNRTSPVSRGKTVMQVFLGVSPPDPPPNVVIKLVSTEGDAHGGAKPSMREQMEMHRAVEPCASCHKIMDPIGFSLENFDAVGAWRTEESGKPIDSAGYLVDGTKMNGVTDMRSALVRYSPQFIRVMTDKLMIYALGRGTEYYDMPLMRSILRDSEKTNYKFSSLVLGIVKSDPFQMNMKPLPEQRASK